MAEDPQPDLNQELVAKYPAFGKWDKYGDGEEGGGREEALLQYVQARPDFDQLRGNPDQVLAAIDHFASNEAFLINIGGHKAKILRELIAEQKPKVLVECGGYIGYSAILFGDQMRRNGEHGAHVWSLEFSASYAAVARELIAIAGLSDMVTIVVGPAEQSLRSLKDDNKVNRVDFLFLDHVEELYVQEFKVAEAVGLLRTGSYVVADNVVRPGAPAYREHVRQHAGLQSHGVKGLIMPGEFEDELEVSKVL